MLNACAIRKGGGDAVDITDASLIMAIGSLILGIATIIERRKR